MVIALSVLLLFPHAERLLGGPGPEIPNRCWVGAYDGHGHLQATMFEGIDHCEATSPGTMYVEWSDGTSTVVALPGSHIAIVEIGQRAATAESQPIPSLY